MRRIGLEGLLWMLLVIAMASLTACETRSGSCKSVPVIEYSETWRQGLLQELEKSGPFVLQFVGDGIALRDAVRACKGE